MKSVFDLLLQLGIPGSAGGLPGWPLLDKIRGEGAIVLVKLDGERKKDRYTVVVSGGPLGEAFFRKDGDDLGGLIGEAIGFYDMRVWGGMAGRGKPALPGARESPHTEAIRTYDGYFTFGALAMEQLHGIQSLFEEAGLEVELSAGALEFQSVGKDTGRRIVQLFKRVAALLVEADGELRCEVDCGERDPGFEFFTIRQGQLMAQGGCLVRDETLLPVE